VFSQQAFVSGAKLNTDQFKASLGESLQNFGKNSSLNSVWFHGNKCSFLAGHNVKILLVKFVECSVVNKFD